MTSQCPACGARWENGRTCQDNFYQMLFWENENPANGVVHHLMVLCYHLQHPHLYSEDGLGYALGLLKEMLVEEKSLAEIRNQKRKTVDSGRRNWKVTARPESKGSYRNPVHWSMRAADVVAAGEEQYIEQVKTWARFVYKDLQTAENL